ncbi:MAG: circadian clock protein KaiB [Solirubrobacteraceae bacterium]|nr:circadian clock protein KaiB [Solirubrobacteraceae bacterium]
MTPDGPGPAPEPEPEYVLRLYVVAGSPASRRAVSNLRAICEEQLDGRYTLEVIDLREQPALAGERDILAIPTLVRELPPPAQRLIGDLSDRDRLLMALDLEFT